VGLISVLIIRSSAEGHYNQTKKSTSKRIERVNEREKKMKDCVQQKIKRRDWR